MVETSHFYKSEPAEFPLVDNFSDVGHVFDGGIGDILGNPRMLDGVWSDPDPDGPHAEDIRGIDIVIEPVTDHAAVDRVGIDAAADFEEEP